MFQLVKVVLVNIRTKFELSRCLVCRTIEINICSILLIKKWLQKIQLLEDSRSTNGSLENSTGPKNNIPNERPCMFYVLCGIVQLLVKKELILKEFRSQH